MGTPVWGSLYVVFGVANAVLWSGFAANAVLHVTERFGKAALWGWVAMLAITLVAVPLLIGIRVGQGRRRRELQPMIFRAMSQSGTWLGLVFLAMLAVLAPAAPDAMAKDGIGLFKRVANLRDDRDEVRHAFVDAFTGQQLMMHGQDPGPSFPASITEPSAAKIALDLRHLWLVGSLVGGILKPDAGDDLKRLAERLDAQYGLEHAMPADEVEAKLKGRTRDYLRVALEANGRFVAAHLAVPRPDRDAIRRSYEDAARESKFERVGPTQMRVTVPPAWKRAPVDAYLEDGKWRVDLRGAGEP